jgi:hypothetical protein
MLRSIVSLAFALSLGVLVLALVLLHRGQARMAESDRAFHSGDLRSSVWEAKAAGLAYVPGSEHVARATARLEAIARGAASEGRPELARLAWDALRLLDEQTDYPGRGPTPFGELATAELGRLRAQKTAR